MGVSDHGPNAWRPLIRLLYISDSHQAATGFGTVTRHVLPRLARAGFEIDALALYQDGAGPLRTDYGTAFPVDPRDSMGFSRIELMVSRGPAVAVLAHELVYCSQWAMRLRLSGWRGPIVGLFPVYGPVLAQSERAVLRLMDGRAALSRYGARVVAAHGFSCAPVRLGVDRAVFRPAHPAVRRGLRRHLGWEGRFVVAYVARNRWNKQQPKLLHAAKALRDRGMDDFLFYLHCVPTPSSPHWVPGLGMVAQEYDLLSLRGELGLEDTVVFPDDLSEQSEGIPEGALVQRLQAADCAAHAAHGEGFGLPLIEAMACGLPVLHTADGRVMDEVVGASGWAVTAQDRLTDAFMNDFGDVRPDQWAEALLTLRRRLEEPCFLRAMRNRARRRGRRFRWDDTATELARVIHHTVAPGSAWRRG